MLAATTAITFHGEFVESIVRDIASINTDNCNIPVCCRLLKVRSAVRLAFRLLFLFSHIRLEGTDLIEYIKTLEYLFPRTFCRFQPVRVSLVQGSA